MVLLIAQTPIKIATLLESNIVLGTVLEEEDVLITNVYVIQATRESIVGLLSNDKFNDL